MSNRQGTLYVVATPIGNLDDLSARAREVLAAVSLIAAEDTRRTAKLTHHFAIDTPLSSLHEHNEAERVSGIIERLEAGDDVALVSDAGTPLVSDPGYRLVRTAIQHKLRVVSVPGPSAVTAALAASGLPTDRFTFEGFLPAKRGARLSRLQALRDEPRTLVFFEASHRIGATLAAMAEVFGAEREATVARELTKVHEETLHGTLGEVAQWLAAAPQRQRGEFVIVVRGAAAVTQAEEIEARRVLQVLLKALPPGKAAALAAEITGVERKRLYGWAAQRPDDDA